MLLRALSWRAALLAAACALAPVAASSERAPSFGHAAIVVRDGTALFERDGRPFFVYGAAFFYERLPRERWQPSMDALARLGINTLDLYVPWNWHELADGNFDFEGRTSPRRDLHEVLRLAAAHDFAIVLRPGPVIRNEWRNGGYPAWLLSRPEYAMPVHDMLEGRYPPIATLQNARSDDAAAAWLANATHRRYARRWLERVLRECAPVADRIVAVALDDDQGAYFDNQTYPAPHLRAYLAWLRDVVHGITGPREPVFINTYQMKVPSSSPVWAMGNWYQSSAYALGTHDLSQLERSFGMLVTRPQQPLFASEFQAGWLQQPADARPRPADPSNTQLALATMLGLGVRGIVHFPAQDTLNPAGWEAPFANVLYAWDAALRLDGTRAPRASPVAELGAFVRRYGPMLAAAPVVRDAAIVYWGGSFAPAETTNELIADAAARLADAQDACRRAGLSCAVVDPRVADLRAYQLLVAPPLHLRPLPAVDSNVVSRLRTFGRAGGRIDTGQPSPVRLRADLRALRRRAVVEGVPNASFARVRAGPVAGFFVATNYGNTPQPATRVTVALEPHRRIRLAPLQVPAHGAIVIALDRRGRILPAPLPQAEPAPSATLPRDADVPIRNDARLPATPFATVPASRAIAYRADVFADGGSDVVLDNGVVRLVVAPDAGARALVFEDVASGRNVFSPAGGIRDDVAVEPPLSTSDRIAAYTHDVPAGTFNRSYDAAFSSDRDGAVARFAYDAPDVVPAGARFERTVSLAPGERAFTLDERFSPRDAAASGVSAQRGAVVTSLVVGDGDPQTRVLLQALPGAENALGYYDRATHELASVAWRAGDLDDARAMKRADSLLVRLTLSAAGRARVRFAYSFVGDVASAQTLLRDENRYAQARTSTRRSGP